MPERPISPTVGLIPTSALTDAGAVTEPSVSLPTASAQKFAAAAAPEPELEPARIAVQRVGIVRQAATPAPAADRMRRAEISPLAEICFAENDGARRAQPFRDEGIARGDGTGERKRARGGQHPAGGFDIVFDQYGNAVQRPARAFRGALAIQRFGNRERFRIQLDDGVDARSLLIESIDARQIPFGHRARGELSRAESAVEIVEGGFLEIERLAESPRGGQSGEGVLEKLAAMHLLGLSKRRRYALSNAPRPPSRR